MSTFARPVNGRGPGPRGFSDGLLFAFHLAESRKLPREALAGALILFVVLAIGLATAASYGTTIDEFNTDDYGPKALAWYLSGFKDRSQFETVEFSLWYYGPWFQMLTAAAQRLQFADPLAVRHAMTFLVGLAGLAALLGIGRLSFGAWVGVAALGLCLLTGYLYGNLFFAPIDVPFLAAMCWATLAIMWMGRYAIPTWTATAWAGLATGLAIATRTGGIITHAYLAGVMALCAIEAIAGGMPARHAFARIALRTAAAIALAWMVAVAIWPWLQLGNPFSQFAIAYKHFANLPTGFDFDSWGARVTTTDLPWTYIPGQWLARLPTGFLVLLALAPLLAAAVALRFAKVTDGRLRVHGVEGLRRPLLLLAHSRNALLVWVAAIAPVAFLIVQHATLYDGIRHTLFVIPMLAVLAGWVLVRASRWSQSWSQSWSQGIGVPHLLGAAYVGALAVNLATLHPLEYIAMNSLAGGVSGAYGRFELDYWSAAATEALHALDRRIAPMRRADQALPSVLVCIPYREPMVQSLLGETWRLELEADKADFVIESERSRCAQDHPNLVLIDEVKRRDRAFAWTYVNPSSRFYSGGP
jgi:hypothetical protein